MILFDSALPSNASIAGSTSWKLSTGIRREISNLPEGSAADINVVTRTRTSWNQTADVLFRPVNEQVYRLRIRRFDGRKRKQKFAAVDAEVQCTQDQAKALEQLLVQYLASPQAETVAVA